MDSLPFRLYPVGRLDYHTEGLLILTNDGDLAQQLNIHRIQSRKFTCKGKRHSTIQSQLRNFVRDHNQKDAKPYPQKSELLDTRKNAWIEVVYSRRKTKSDSKDVRCIGHPVLKLKRIAIGSLSDDRLNQANIRILKTSEIRKLLKALQLKKGNKHEKQVHALLFHRIFSISNLIVQENLKKN